MITIIILSLLALTIFIAWVFARRRKREARGREEIPLFSVPGATQTHVARPPQPTPRSTPSSFDSRGAASLRETAGERESRLSPSAPTIRTRDGAVSTLARPQRDDSPVAPSDEEVGEAFEGESVRYWRVADGTLQFLPGRLEIAAGRDAGQEIRFVRTSGPDGTCITFGRAEGAPYRHVQLREPTVSRAHARMALEQPTTPSGMPTGATGGNPARWRLENLSTTNPVVVNGRALDARSGAAASVILSDGDRIEMGEVAFVFHAR